MHNIYQKEWILRYLMKNKNKKKIEISCFLAYGAICISVYSDLFRKEDALTIGMIMAISLEQMLFYVMLWNVSFFVGHLSAHIYYKKEGLGDSPVLIFSICDSQREKSAFILQFVSNGKLFLSFQIFFG